MSAALFGACIGSQQAPPPPPYRLQPLSLNTVELIVEGGLVQDLFLDPHPFPRLCSYPVWCSQQSCEGVSEQPEFLRCFYLKVGMASMSTFGIVDFLAATDWYFIAEWPTQAPHLARPEGCSALRIVPVTVPRVSRSCEHFPDGFDVHLLC